MSVAVSVNSPESSPAKVEGASESLQSATPTSGNGGGEGSQPRQGGASGGAGGLNAHAKSFVPGRLESGGNAPAASAPTAGAPNSPKPMLHIPAAHHKPANQAGSSTGGPSASSSRSPLLPPPAMPMMNPAALSGAFFPNMMMPGMFGALMPSPFAANPLALASPGMAANPTAAAMAANMGRLGHRPPLGTAMPPLGGVPSALGMPPLMSPLMPPPPPPPPTTPASPQVSVGNAALAALRSTAPPKFACVLLVGLPKVGKTTVGRLVIKHLNDEGINWSFFSGGDFIRNDAARSSPWLTTKDIFDALSQKLDDVLSKQSTSPIRGLVIDKQCRGTEELYYLTAVLRSKGLSLNGVVGLEAASDDKLAERLNLADDDGFKEKLKYHHVVLNRIKETAKAVGLWHVVDALQSEAEVAHRLRSMILGCSSQVPAKQLVASAYHESIATMVDGYIAYANTMNTLFQLVKVAKPGQFPGFSNYVPVTTAMLAEQSKTAARKAMGGGAAAPLHAGILRECCVRRKSDGVKYVLVYDGTGIFLVPRHMRCVFSLTNDAWLGAPLTAMGKFVVEGELVRLAKERQREKFIVTDVLYIQDKGSAVNAVQRSTWRERQERLKTQLCCETSAFYSKGDVVIVHQSFEEFRGAARLLESYEYPTEGLVFVQPSGFKRDDPQFLWRPPESITVDFRLGPVLQKTETTATFQLQVFDQWQAKYVPFAPDSVVDVPLPRPFAIEGAVAICGLDPTTVVLPSTLPATATGGAASVAQSAGGSTGAAAAAAGSGGGATGAASVVTWVFHRTRSDVTIATFKDKVQELLAEGLIPRSVMAQFLAPPAAAAEASASVALASPSPVPTSGTAASASATGRSPPGGVVPTSAAVSSGTFGSPKPSSSFPTHASAPTTVRIVVAPGLDTLDTLRQVIDGNVRSHHADTAVAPLGGDEGANNQQRRGGDGGRSAGVKAPRGNRRAAAAAPISTETTPDPTQGVDTAAADTQGQRRGTNRRRPQAAVTGSATDATTNVDPQAAPLAAEGSDARPTRPTHRGSRGKGTGTGSAPQQPPSGATAQAGTSGTEGTAPAPAPRARRPRNPKAVVAQGEDATRAAPPTAESRPEASAA